MYETRCVRCKTFITHDHYEWPEGKELLCSFCLDQSLKAIKHREYIEWLEKLEQEDAHNHKRPLTAPNYIWR